MTVPGDLFIQVLCSPTKNTLQSMVTHFQKLFDVRSLRGVYPRMSEVYTRLGEMSNAMRNLRDVLDLGQWLNLNVLPKPSALGPHRLNWQIK